MKSLLSSIDRSSVEKRKREQKLVEKLRELKKVPLEDIRTSFLYRLSLDISRDARLADAHKEKEKEISVLVDTLNGKTKKMLLLLEKWDGARAKVSLTLSLS